MDGPENVRRRDFLKGVAAGAVAGLTADTREAAAGSAPAPADPGSHGHHHAPRTNAGPEPLRFFNDAEAATLATLADTLIPEDDVGPSGVEAGVVVFIDREMAGGFGRGARMYMQGPFRQGTPQQGYQLPLTPAEVYRIGLADLNAWCAANYGGKSFDQLAGPERTAALKLVEAGKAEFRQVPARIFFELLLQNAMEGYFGDPAHGGNRNKASWRMIGFPGADAVYVDKIEEYRNKKYDAEPHAIADL